MLIASRSRIVDDQSRCRHDRDRHYREAGLPRVNAVSLPRPRPAIRWLGMLRQRQGQQNPKSARRAVAESARRFCFGTQTSFAQESKSVQNARNAVSMRATFRYQRRHQDSLMPGLATSTSAGINVGTLPRPASSTPASLNTGPNVVRDAGLNAWPRRRLNTRIVLGVAAASIASIYAGLNADALALRWITCRITSGMTEEMMATAGPTAPWPESLAEIIGGTAGRIMVTRAAPSQSVYSWCVCEVLQLVKNITPSSRHYWTPEDRNQNHFFLGRPARGLEWNSSFFGPLQVAVDAPAFRLPPHRFRP